MKQWLATICLLFSGLRLIPHLLVLWWHPRRHIMELDLARWAKERAACVRVSRNPGSGWDTVCLFVQLMTRYPEFRSLFYHRLGWAGKILHPLCRPLSTLYIYTQEIGPGLFIQHGFATIIAAQSIGRNCWINQQVTIGYANDTDCPTLGDNVTVYAGAKIIGKVKVGNNAVVGANTVVIGNVPENCTAFGVPARIFGPPAGAGAGGPLHTE